jgi:hypothetical protein
LRGFNAVALAPRVWRRRYARVARSHIPGGVMRGMELGRSPGITTAEGRQSMNLKRIGLAVVLADFLAFSAYAVYQHGLVGFFQLVTANSATTLALVDLTIALTLIVGWMWRDARDRGVSVLPYALITLALGSAGPLLYLLMRGDDRPRRQLAARAA